MEQEKVNEILEKHKKWYYDQANGERADLRGAKLCGADLRGAKNIPFIPYACPNSGSFIGYKKASNLIVELIEEVKQ